MNRVSTIPAPEGRLRFMFALLAHEIVGHDYGSVFDPPAESIRIHIESLSEARRKDENVPTHFQLAICGQPDCIRKLRTRKDFSTMFDRLIAAYKATLSTTAKLLRTR